MNMWRFCLCIIYITVGVYSHTCIINQEIENEQMVTDFSLLAPNENIQICITVGISEHKFNVRQAMQNQQVIPDVIPVAPKEILQVNYASGKKALLGNELTPTEVKDLPSVSWNADPNSFYLLCLTDPDAPSRAEPTIREWHHWLVGNIPGKNVSLGETLSEYLGSGPPPEAGIHRYVFLVYKQPSKLSFDEPRLNNRSVEHREKFSINKFALKYNLGTPVAGNFYLAQYDDYVPTLYQQLGIN
ncbi:protein D3-like isoform X2 [Melanaphis sacchari]|uniref:protein D3-like isoform X2 n=1 Tax=Melanaphis sacchari TaxID=742174 RepID=UPI000DC1573A|nr:protein D3-like isoform X2 [Melanaphis sacchari]